VGLPPTGAKGYPVAGWSADPRAAAVAEALAAYGWRDFTKRMLARYAVGSVDRYTILCFVSGVPGASAGGPEPVQPADPGDPRVDLLVGRLEARQWRSFSLERLCAVLISDLAAWQAGWESPASGERGAVGDH
jgi:hypothetical protein